MNWDEYFFNLIENIKLRSKDPNTQVGCLIVGPCNEIRSTGYNGPPLGVDFDKDRTPERLERPLKYQFTEHAERNAIYFGARTGTSLEKCKIYQTWFPCCDCARAIIQVGIEEIVIDGRTFEQNSKYWNKRWFDSICISTQMCIEADIDIRIYELKIENKIIQKNIYLNNYKELCTKYCLI